MSKIGIIIGREFNVRVRKKSFILLTILMPLLMVGLIAVPVLVQMYGGDTSEKRIVVVDSSGLVSDNFRDTEQLKFMAVESTYPEVVEDYPGAYGYLVIDSDVAERERGVAFYTSGSSTLSDESTIKRQIEKIITQKRIDESGVANLDSLIQSVEANVKISTFSIVKGKEGEISQKASSSGVSMGVAYAASFIIYMFVLMYGMMVFNGVIEEKSNRIMEIMVSSVKPFELMMGKILGIACVAILQFTIWIVLGFVGVMVVSALGGVGAAGDMAASGVMDSGVALQTQGMVSSELSAVLSTLGDPSFIARILGGFIIYFVGGYLLYASMYAAIGSAVESAADGQQLQMPVTIPLIAALFVMMSAMQDPNSPLAFWCSFIPFTSPIVMMARLAYGVEWWEFILSVVLLYSTFVAMTYFASKIYRVGIFMYGKKPTLREMLRWIKY